MTPEQTTYGSPTLNAQHPAPWWYRLAARLFPDRCREIPEAANPTWPDGSPRIVLRQVALVKRYVYLQQFASAEDPRYMHSHQWHRTIAIGLWGSYTEHRIAGPFRKRRAPYAYTMDASIVHHVQAPGPGHTSLFIGLWRDDDLKHYYGNPRGDSSLGIPDELVRTYGLAPATFRRLWSDHIKVMVKRI